MTLQHIKALVCDIDGVVLYGHDAPFSERQTAVPADIIIPFFKEHWNDCVQGKKDTKETLITHFQVHGLAEKDALAFMQKWHGEKAEVNQKLWQWIEQNLPHVSRYLATNQDPYRATHLWETVNLKEKFSRMFASGHMQLKKPDAAFFQAVQTGIEAEQGAIVRENVLFLDDSAKNVEAAKAFGWQAYVYNDFNQFQEELERTN